MTNYAVAYLHGNSTRANAKGTFRQWPFLESCIRAHPVGDVRARARRKRMPREKLNTRQRERERESLFGHLPLISSLTNGGWSGKIGSAPMWRDSLLDYCRLAMIQCPLELACGSDVGTTSLYCRHPDPSPTHLPLDATEITRENTMISERVRFRFKRYSLNLNISA